MNIQEILNKQLKGEELTAEEQELLKAFEEAVNKTSEDKTKKLAEELNSLKSIAEQKTELEKTIEDLKNKYNLSNNEAEKIRKEKEGLEKQIQEETTNIEDLRASLRKIADEQKEKELKAQREEQEKKLQAQREEMENRIKQMEEQLKAQVKLNEVNQFKQEVMSEKAKRPYLDSELDKILTEIEVNGLDKSKMIFNFLLEMKNHEQEMDLYKKKQEAGSSILKDKEIKIDTVDSFEEFLKRKKNLK